jgi:hypothetical protein
MRYQFYIVLSILVMSCSSEPAELEVVKEEPATKVFTGLPVFNITLDPTDSEKHNSYALHSLIGAENRFMVVGTRFDLIINMNGNEGVKFKTGGAYTVKAFVLLDGKEVTDGPEWKSEEEDLIVSFSANAAETLSIRLAGMSPLSNQSIGNFDNSKIWVTPIRKMPTS